MNSPGKVNPGSSDGAAMKSALGILAALLVGGVPAAAQDAEIDPLTLPAGGVEQTYACRSYLNAFSAMLRAHNPRDETGRVLLGLYLVMSNEAVTQSAANDIAPDAATKRMNAWDAAVVTATLTSLKANEDRFGENLRTCMKIASAAAERGPRAPAVGPAN